MKKKSLILAFLFLLSFSFAGVYNITACGNFTAPATNTIYNFTANINITTASVISNGACVYIQNNATAKTFFFFNNATIRNVNSTTVQSAITIKSDAAGAAIDLNWANGTNNGIANRINTENVPASIYFIGNRSSGTGVYNFFGPSDSSMPILYIYATNGTLFYNETIAGAAATPFSLIMATNITAYVCNVSQLFRKESNRSDQTPLFIYSQPGCPQDSFQNVSQLLFTATDNATYGYLVYPFQLFNSNKLFNSNGNITFNYNATGNGTISLLHQNFIYSYSTTNPNLYFIVNPYTTNASPNAARYGFNATSIYNMTGKTYYCVGGLCNPLYFANFSTWPFYINVPDTLAVAKITNTYTTIRIWWVQGLSNYLIASSINNQDQFFELQPNGVYIMEINNGTNTTNTTITNSCPNIYSVCQIIIGTNGTYSITPISNYQAMWNDINYSILPSDFWFKNNTNISFNITSLNSSLVLWGMQVDKYFNGTHSVFFALNSTNASGGFMQIATNGTGRYVITTLFRSTNFQIYRPLARTVYVANATGLAAISEKLNSGTLIDGWTYTLIALIITAIVVGFISRYTIDGAGFVGIAVFTIFALLYPSAIVFGSISIVVLDIIMALMVFAMFAIKQYI